jgi:hypothetical protein
MSNQLLVASKPKGVHRETKIGYEGDDRGIAEIRKMYKQKFALKIIKRSFR